MEMEKKTDTKILVIKIKMNCDIDCFKIINHLLYCFVWSLITVPSKSIGIDNRNVK